jgi:hypothetical protein
MKIITQFRYRNKGGDPSQIKKLEQQRDNYKKDLNSILNEWKWGDQPIKTSEEFLNKFKPWIKSRNEEMEELKKFCKKHKITSLKDIKGVKIKGG